MEFFDILVLFVFIFSLIVIGLYKSKKNISEATYLVANRKIHLFSLVATLVMTEFNSATLIAFPANFMSW